MNNDFLLNSDAGLSSILVHIDISAAIDTIDHALLNSVRDWVRIYII